MFLAVKNRLPSIRRRDLETDAQILSCELRPDSRRKILAVVFYRPQDTDLEYLKQLKKTLLLASKAKFDQILGIGDFNLSEIDWQTGTAIAGDCLHNYFTKLVKDNYLWQLVDFPTRGKNILDLVLTTSPTKVQHIHRFNDIICTDHKLISFELDLKVPKRTKTKRVVYNFKRADWSGLKETLRNTTWDACIVPDDADASLENWYDLFVAAANDHIPKCKARSVNDLPWMDNELRLLLKKKDDPRSKFKRKHSSSTEAKFIELRRFAKEMLMRKKMEHAGKLKASISENPKRFWFYIKSTTSDRPSPNFLRDGHKLVTDIQDGANILNKFFSSVFNPASTASPTLSALPFSGVGEKLDSIELTASEVREVLLSLDPNKASGPDNIPGSLLKNTAAEIAPSLCKIFNLSLSHGVVPVLWKRANVTPVFKKDDPTLAENYRPISLLCIVSKVLKRCVFNHCYPHFAPLLYNLQHGFLRGKSTVTQLLEVYHDILDMVAGGQEIDVIHLDLSKAFDKVPHDLLLTKLHRHGISGTALQWFEGYLSNRQQRVILEGTFSDWLPVTSGVSQGSILGPLLFLVFANEMPSYVQHGSTLTL